jgi:hypothetical protein
MATVVRVVALAAVLAVVAAASPFEGHKLPEMSTELPPLVPTGAFKKLRSALKLPQSPAPKQNVAGQSWYTCDKVIRYAESAMEFCDIPRTGVEGGIAGSVCGKSCLYSVTWYIEQNVTCFTSNATWAPVLLVAKACETCHNMTLKVAAVLLGDASCIATFKLADDAATEHTFLGTFCNSSCKTALVAAADYNHSCFLTRDFSMLKHLLGICKGPAKCYGSGLSALTLKYNTNCRHDGQSLVSLAGDIKNLTQQARDAVDMLCSSSGQCVSLLKSLVNDYAECYPREFKMTQMVTAVTTLCDKHDGVYCWWRLRGIHSLECSSHNITVCLGNYSSTQFSYNASKWCQWVKGKCEPRPTPAQLDSVCNPCLTKMALLAESLDIPNSAFSTFQSVYCRRRDNQYCFPMLMKGSDMDDRFLAPGRYTNLTYAEANASTAYFCSNNTLKRCFRSLMMTFVRAGVEYATKSFIECARSRSSLEGVKQSCLLWFHYQMMRATKTQGLLLFLCSKNDAGAHCAPFVSGVANHSCFRVVQGQSCDDTCNTFYSTLLTDAGCCLDHVNRYFDENAPTRYDRALSPVVQYRGAGGVMVSEQVKYPESEAYNPANLTTHALRGTFQCSSMQTAAAVTKISTPCSATVTKCSKALKLYGLLWTRIASNAAVKARIGRALALDIVLSLGALPEQLLNGMLVEDTSQTLTDKATKATSSGVKFTFDLVGDDAADTTLTCAEFDRLMSSRALTAPGAAEAISQECSTCTEGSSGNTTDTGTTVAGETTTAAPAGNLFAGLVGGDTKLFGGASGVAAALAALVAVLALVF